MNERAQQYTTAIVDVGPHIDVAALSGLLREQGIRIVLHDRLAAPDADAVEQIVDAFAIINEMAELLPAVELVGSADQLLSLVGVHGTSGETIVFTDTPLHISPLHEAGVTVVAVGSGHSQQDLHMAHFAMTHLSGPAIQQIFH